MATYTSQAELQDLTGVQFTRLADRTGNGVADQTVIDQAMALADSAVDSILAGYTDIPAAAPLIRQAATQIARYALYTEERPEHIEKAGAWARNMLQRIAEGKVVIAGLTAAQESTVVRQADIDASGRRYTRSFLTERGLP